MRGCRVCLGKPRRGTKCMFCGFKIKAKKDMDKRELHTEECFEAHLAYLKTVYSKLLAFRMLTTGTESVDEEVRHYYGDWRLKL